LSEGSSVAIHIELLIKFDTETLFATESLTKYAFEDESNIEEFEFPSSNWGLTMG
jgi:hypothetical protein